jgi:hypothetical protein
MIASLWAKALSRQAGRVAAHIRGIRKASSEDRERIEDAALAAGVALSDDEMDQLAEELGDYAAESAEAGYAQIGGEVGEGHDDIFDQINERSAAWAEDRAAEMVSSIDETTRDAVRDAVADGLAEGLTAEEIADRIEGIGDAGGMTAFGDQRAALIANTEIANANSAGALEGYKQARDGGVNVMKEWLTDDDPCDVCQENADAGAIDLDEDFPSGDAAPSAHPRCLCAVSPVVVGKSSDESGEEAEPED